MGQRSWYTVPRVFMYRDKPCEKTLGLEPSLRNGSLYVYGVSRAVMFPGQPCEVYLGRLSKAVYKVES